MNEAKRNALAVEVRVWAQVVLRCVALASYIAAVGVLVGVPWLFLWDRGLRPGESGMIVMGVEGFLAILGRLLYGYIRRELPVIREETEIIMQAEARRSIEGGSLSHTASQGGEVSEAVAVSPSAGKPTCPS